MERNPPSADLHVELRNATRALHRDLDHHAVLSPLAASTSTLHGYQRALLALHAISTPVEDQVAAYIDVRGLTRNYAIHRRTPDLLRDIDFYGLTPYAAPWNGPTIVTDAELVGCLYVLEGAARGGRVIIRRMNRTLGIAGERGGRYFSGLGDQADSIWQEFWGFAADHCPPEHWPETCRAASVLLRSYLVLLDRYSGR